jgi:hypothetical protein
VRENERSLLLRIRRPEHARCTPSPFDLQRNEFSPQTLCANFSQMSNFRKRIKLCFPFIVDEWTKTSTKLACSRCARNVAKLKNRNRGCELQQPAHAYESR